MQYSEIEKLIYFLRILSLEYTMAEFWRQGIHQDMLVYIFFWGGGV